MSWDVRWLALYVLIAVAFSIIAYIISDKDDRDVR